MSAFLKNVWYVSLIQCFWDESLMEDAAQGPGYSNSAVWWQAAATLVSTAWCIDLCNHYVAHLKLTVILCVNYTSLKKNVSLLIETRGGLDTSTAGLGRRQRPQRVADSHCLETHESKALYTRSLAAWAPAVCLLPTRKQTNQLLELGSMQSVKEGTFRSTEALGSQLAQFTETTVMKC